MRKIIYLSFFVIAIVQAQHKNIDQEFKNYWYSGKAEVSSYDLEQARYGEIRKGYAVNIFVTEPFAKKYNTKADKDEPGNISVLKLNTTKKFNTGVYPYSIMTSSFLPVNTPKASLKISSSTQEWCGHEYIELVDKEEVFVMNNFSYFQGESFQNNKMPKDIVLEDDIWSKIRLTPKVLPQGEFMALPSFVYLRFSHNDVKEYKANGKLINDTDVMIYEIAYPTLERTLKITFENKFPYKIKGWQETYYSGWGAQRKKMSSKGTLKKTLNIPYWNTNKNKDLYLREELGLN